MIVCAILSQDFMRHAFVAGSAIAVAAGLVGYFLVLRGQVFAGDALSHVAFTGSLAALAFGINQRIGLVVATLAVALLLAGLSRRRLLDDVAIGTTFSWLLGLGSLFLYLFTTRHSTSNGTASPNVLFGSIYGISETQTVVAVLASVVVIGGIAAIGRPLLFASLDSTVAAARGVRVNLINTVFLVVLALQVAETVQVVGALLLLGLLAAPGAAAAQLTSHPYRAMLISSGLCLIAVWAGLTISYVFPSLPPSFVIITVAFAFYTVTVVYRRLSPRY